MTRPVFGRDRDPLASATWGDQHDSFVADDEPCEVHGYDREACRRFNEDAEDSERIAESLADVMLGDPRDEAHA